MQLDQITTAVRRRTDWEGIDLGFAMARQWFLPLWGLWWITALPVTLLAALVLHESPIWFGIAVWWFKPLYEPFLLYWLSRRLFGEQLSWREIVGQWRRLLPPRLLANLLWRRYSTNRSFFMPVSHLEGLTGKERTKRLKVLRGSRAAGSWLTLGGAHLEFVLELSFLLLVVELVPKELLPGNLWELFTNGNLQLQWMIYGFWLLAMSLFAPFYVAGGFALYLTRRSELEAWDLELSFRRMAPRFRTPNAIGLVLVFCVAMATLLPAPRAEAADQCAAPDAQQTTKQEQPKPLPPQEGELPGAAHDMTAADARHTIDEVMKEKDFGETHTVSYWHYIGDKKKGDKKSASHAFEWVRYLADFFEYVLWVGGVIALGWILLYLLRLTDWLPKAKGARKSAAPAMLFGLAVTPDSLPDDVPAAIHALLAQHKARAALSLLYRATLVKLIHAHDVRIPDSATEGECRRIVQTERPAHEADLFSRLTDLWVRCAYGHIELATAEIAALANDWNAIYGGTRDEK